MSDTRLPYTAPTVTPLTEHEVILTIGRTLKKDGWHTIGNGRWQAPDGRVFDPHTAVMRGKLLPAWRVWRDTGELVTTGVR